VVLKKDKKKLEKEIIKFLDESSMHKNGPQDGCGLKHGIACALGTSKDNIPRVTPVDFFNEGLILWIIGDPGGKIGNIRSNPHVSVGIYTPLDHSKVNRSMQIWGKATLINIIKNKNEFNKKVEELGIIAAVRNITEMFVKEGVLRSEDKEKVIEKRLKSINLIKIEPVRIAYLIVKPAQEPEKYIWIKSR
jgi:hypothetical protein